MFYFLQLFVIFRNEKSVPGFPVRPANSFPLEGNIKKVHKCIGSSRFMKDFKKDTMNGCIDKLSILDLREFSLEAKVSYFDRLDCK